MITNASPASASADVSTIAKPILSTDAPELLDIALEVVQGNYTIESYSLLESVDYWGGVFGDAQYFYCVYDINRASDWLYRTIYEDLYISSYPD